MSDALSCDAFMGGRLHLWQPRKGYRAGVDPVILAASIEARAGQSLLDLGCGAGAAMLCVATRVKGVQVTGLELQAVYADLARRNAAENSIQAEVVTGSLADMPAALKQRRFDHVIANPPYFDRSRSTAAQDAGRETAMALATPLEAWVASAAKRCAPKGFVTLIHRAERLPELLAFMSARLGAIECLPLIPRHGRAAKLVLVRGRMGGRADFRLLDGVRLHDGPDHSDGAENYSRLMNGVLREGAFLPFSS